MTLRGRPQDIEQAVQYINVITRAAGWYLLQAILPESIISRSKKTVHQKNLNFIAVPLFQK